ncbi:MAG: hypothetical protein D6714_08890 [Bacteroidetes bacterium]|nr:MAG: hypothetical protein D6714_08890 [Bacteroidota bacterium]
MKRLIFPMALMIGVFAFFAFKKGDTTASALTIMASNKTAQSGKEVCVDVSVKDFQKILSMQYTMKWQADKLRFKRIDGLNLPGLSASNFGTQATQKGLLTFAWYDPNIRGISLTDGSSIYQVCFDVIGKAGDKAYLQFTGYPTVIEITDAQSNFLDLNATPGIVKIR